ncbi:hypothetical protein [Secundilactobacillus odoratitofui]|nr:hypothetical protein [Secundilactobacillus odoratitofui]
MKRVLQLFVVVVALGVLGVAAHHLMTPTASEHAATQTTKKTNQSD